MREASQLPAWPQTSEPWFRALSEATTIAIFVFREKFLYCNRATEALTGYEAGELTEMFVWDVVHPDFRDAVRRRVGARLRGEEVADPVEFKIVTKAGVERWVELAARTFSHDGLSAGLGTAHDVTDARRAAAALSDSEEKYRLLVEHQTDLVIKLDPEGRLTFVSPSFCGFFGGTEEEFVLRDAFTLAGGQQPALARLLERLRQPPHVAHIELRVRGADGAMHWLLWAGRAVLDEQDGLREVVAVGRDITERKLAEEALYQEKERALVTLAAIGDGVVRSDAEGRIDYVNPVAELLTGWRTPDAYGRRVAEVFRVVDAASRQPVEDAVELCLREQRPVSPPGDRVLVRADGAEFAVRDSATPIRDRAGRTVGAVLVFKDLTELRGMEREMSYLASYDPLTGLLNRREFEKRLQRALALYAEQGTPHTLCYLDLDEFKVINDTCGHVAGDEMLKQVSALLQWRAPEGITLARLGGDEFGVLIEVRPLAEARALARELLREILAFRFTWRDRTFAAGVSMGLVPFGADTGDLAALLSAADAACYVAKESGRNRIHEYRPHDRALAERYGEMQWIHRIGKALEEERFRLYYQTIKGIGPGANEPLAEVFIRLLDEQGELVAPSAFIPAAERYHMIPSIDRWVVSHTLATLRRRDDLPAQMCFAINLSGQSLGEEAFQHFVIDALRGSGIDPRRVCFEITETAAIANLGRAMSFIAVLRRMGCRFVLDDFGSGFSSFGYLKNLPVDFLKIDGEFVRGIASDPIDRALVQAINQVGHVLGVRTIAEAVEDEAMLRQLLELGVDYAQGYWISKPVPLPFDPPAPA